MTHSHPTIRQQSKKNKRYDTPKIYVEEVVEEVVEEKTEMPRKPKPKPFKVKPKVDLDVTAIVVNFKTENLIKQAVQTFRGFYKTVPLIIIDNASNDDSTQWISKQANEYTEIVLNDTNIGHGPALHQGLSLCKTKYVFTFDSDIVFNKDGFLEEMQRLINNNYAVGWLRWVNDNGVSIVGNPTIGKHHPYIHPCFALFNLEIYKTLEPFANKGAPLIYNMRDAEKRGYDVLDFQFEKYATHLIAGTRRMYRGHWFAENREPQKWDEKARIPI